MIAAHEIAPTHIGTGLAAAIRDHIPMLETRRLTLRAMEMQDFPCLDGIVNGPGGSGVGGPQPRDETWFDFAQMMATWTWRGHGWWTVCTHDDTTEALGFAGIGFEPGDQEPELGYMFAQKAQRQGYATEVGQAVLRFARTHLGLKTLVSYINPDNTRSIAVAERLGAARDTDSETALAKTLPDESPVRVYRYDLGRRAAP